MHHDSLSADRQRTIGGDCPSRAIFYVVAHHSESSPIKLRQCVHRAGVTWCTFLVAAQNMEIIETWWFIAALPKVNFHCHGTPLKSLWSIGAGGSARKRMNRMDNRRILGI
jgi:hypothetical protein